MGKDYEIGYGKPPKATQFKKGQSGNPKGRLKGSRNFKTDVMEVLNARVQLKDKSGGKTVSTQMAGLLRLREQALKGDFKALDRLLQLALAFNGDADEAGAPALAPDDAAILKAFTQRARRREAASSTAPDGADAKAPNAGEEDDDDWLR